MLHPEQLRLLQKRFSHFDADADADACAQLFSQDQEESGLTRVRGQGLFPGIRMANGVSWFPDRGNRPVGKDGPMKARAPTGLRRLLVGKADAAELLVVEGEGHAVAVMSVGYKAVVACGGVKALLSPSPEARGHRLQVFEGKQVRLLFDFDEPGQSRIHEVAQRILEAGATGVALVAPQEDWQDKWDVEDWLASFQTRPTAYTALCKLLTSQEWLGPRELGARTSENEYEPEPVEVESERVPIPGTGRCALVTAIYERKEDRLRLAVLAPENLLEGTPPEPDPSVRHDERPSELWQVGMVDEWLFRGRMYVPPRDHSIRVDVRERAVTVPPPPTPITETDEALWDDLVDFLKGWLVLPHPEFYDAIAAWVLLSWRLNDLGFRYVPPLRFSGPPGTGKSVALTCIHALSFFARMCRWTPENLHRVADAHRDGVLVFDELHLNRGRDRSSQERMADQIATGWDRQAREARYEGGRGGMQSYRTFVMWASAGYRADENEGLARRSVVIRMERVALPLDRQYLDMPKRFYNEADALQARLLVWRLRHAENERQDEEASVLADCLKRTAGSEIGQAFWPLVQMIPAGRPDALDRLLKYASSRRKTVRETVQHEEAAHLLSVVADMINQGLVLPTEHGVRVPVKQLVPHAREMFQGISSQQVHRELRQSAGFRKRQLVVRKGEEALAHTLSLARTFDGYELDLRDGSCDRRAFEAHGVELAPWTELRSEPAGGGEPENPPL